MPANHSGGRTFSRTAFPAPQPSLFGYLRDAPMDTAQKGEQSEHMGASNAKDLLDPDHKLAAWSGSVPRGSKVPRDDLHAGGLKVRGNRGGEGASRANGTGFMFTIREESEMADAPAMPFTPQRSPSEASSSNLPRVAMTQSTTNGSRVTQQRQNIFNNRKLAASASLQTPPRASTSTNAKPAGKPLQRETTSAYVPRFNAPPKMLTRPIRVVKPATEKMRPKASNEKDRAATSLLPAFEMSPTTPTKSTAPVAREASVLMLSPPAATTSRPSFKPSEEHSPLSASQRAPKPLQRQQAITDMMAPRLTGPPIPPPIDPTTLGFPPYIPRVHEKTTDPRLRLRKPAAKPIQQEAVTDTTTPIPTKAATPLVRDTSMRAPSPPPSLPATTNSLFAGWKDEDFSSLLSDLRPAPKAVLEPVEPLALLGAAFELKAPTVKRPSTPPLAPPSPSPVARAPVPLLDLESLADMDVDVDMVDDFDLPPTSLYQSEDEIMMDLPVRPEEFAVASYHPIIAPQVDLGPAVYLELPTPSSSLPTAPGLGTESLAVLLGLIPPPPLEPVGPPCPTFSQDLYPALFCNPPLSTTVLETSNSFNSADDGRIRADNILDLKGSINNPAVAITIVPCDQPGSTNEEVQTLCDRMQRDMSNPTKRRPRPWQDLRHRSFQSTLRQYRPAATQSTICRIPFKPIPNAPPPTGGKLLFLAPPPKPQEFATPRTSAKRARRDDDEDDHLVNVERPRQKKRRRAKKEVEVRAPVGILKRAKEDDKTSESVGIVQRPKRRKRRVPSQSVGVVPAETEPGKPEPQVRWRQMNDVQGGEPVPIKFDTSVPDPILPGHYRREVFIRRVAQPTQPAPSALPQYGYHQTQVDPQPVGLLQSAFSFFRTFFA